MTTTASELATALTDGSQDMLLINFDLMAPDLGSFLRVGSYTMKVEYMLSGRGSITETASAALIKPMVLPSNGTFDSNLTALRRLASVAFNAFNVVLFTDEPFRPVGEAALSVADGSLAVSTPGETDLKDTAVLHDALAERDAQPLGTILTGVFDLEDASEWECTMLAGVSETDTVASPAFVLEQLSDPAAEVYLQLAAEFKHLGLGRGGIKDGSPSQEQENAQLSQSTDPFFTQPTGPGKNEASDETGGLTFMWRDTISTAVGLAGAVFGGYIGFGESATERSAVRARQTLGVSEAGYSETMTVTSTAVATFEAGVTTTQETPSNTYWHKEGVTCEN